MSEFSKTVYELVKQIPPGKVATYGQLAFLAGRPRAARIVGGILNKAPNSFRAIEWLTAKAGRSGFFPDRD